MNSLKVTKSSKSLNNTRHNVFCTDSFLSSQSNDFGWIHNDDYCIPYYIKKKFIFKSLIFTSDAVPKGKTNDKESKKYFFDSLLDKMKELLNIDFIVCPPTFVLFETTPIKSKRCNFGSFKINLKNNENDLFANLHSKHRNVIRKSIKDDIKIEFGKEYFNQCYKVIYDTHNRQNIMFPSFEEIKELFKSLNNKIICVVAIKDNIIQGGAFIPWNENSGYYLYGGSIERSHTGAMNHLQWEVILKLKQLEVSKYDFVGARLNPKKGSKIEGIQRFKSRFGAELYQGYLWKYDYNKTKKIIYDLLIFIKSGAFPRDIIDNEK